MLDGQGAQKYGGRWNSPGHQVVYLSIDPALCVLEILVNLDLPIDLMPKDYELVCVEFQIKDNEHFLNRVEYPVYDFDHSQSLGDHWLTSMKTLTLAVPSVIMPESSNLLVNPQHPLMEHVSIQSKRDFKFDDRLLMDGSKNND